jgi:hypothetical protein
MSWPMFPSADASVPTPYALTTSVCSSPKWKTSNSYRFVGMSRQAFTGLFGFTLPLGYEHAISRYMANRAVLRRQWWNSVGDTIPCIGRAHHLLCLLQKIPIESGIFDQSLITRLNHMRQTRNSACMNVIAASSEISTICRRPSCSRDTSCTSCSNNHRQPLRHG